MQVSTALYYSLDGLTPRGSRTRNTAHGTADMKHSAMACSVEELYDDIKFTYVASLHQLYRSIISDASLPTNQAQTVGLPDDLMVVVNEEPEQEFTELLRALHPYLDEHSGTHAQFSPCAV